MRVQRGLASVAGYSWLATTTVKPVRADRVRGSVRANDDSVCLRSPAGWQQRGHVSLFGQS